MACRHCRGAAPEPRHCPAGSPPSRQDDQIVPPDSPAYFDLEDPTSLARLNEPMTALGALRGTVVIDEIQRRPDLFPVLRVLADRRPLRARFLILGSASPDLLRQASESLAGRLETITLAGFSLPELGAKALARHWRRGGFPPAYLARSEAASLVWRRQFIQTYLERDLPQLGITIPAATLLRFWTMLAHYHGGIWNAAEAARSLGVSEPTARRYLDLLTGLFLVRQLPPWHENLKKRQVKAPKVYVRDSGRDPVASKGRSVLGRLRDGGGAAVGPPGSGALLGDSHRRGARPSSHRPRPSHRDRGEVSGCAPPDAVDADRAR
ncbi:MAG: ATP-binding protein [Vicinamibacterales bacterium]|nr:ATP-binding protein [Vicinamibacterales bacterium]